MNKERKLDWPAIHEAISEYVAGYELIGEDDAGHDGVYDPTESERYMIQDAISGLLDGDFLKLLQGAGDERPSIDVINGLLNGGGLDPSVLEIDKRYNFTAEISKRADGSIGMRKRKLVPEDLSAPASMEPVAYCVMAENGHIRLWSSNPKTVLNAELDGPIRELVTVEQARAYAAGTKANTSTAQVDALREAISLALEYWAGKQQRYKNRSPVWVQKARAALSGESA